MEKFNLYELNNSPMSDGSSSIDQNLVHKSKNYYENRSLQEHTPTSYEPYLSDEPQLNLVYKDDDAYANVISTGKTIPRNFQRPILQTNYFEEDSPDAYDKNILRDYNRILERHYEARPNQPSSGQYTNSKRMRSKVPSTMKRERTNTSRSKKRKYLKHTNSLGTNEDENNYDPWRDIYQQGLFERHGNNKHMPENKTLPSIKKPPNYHPTSAEVTNKSETKGYQVMASNFLYKTKSGDDLDNDMNDIREGELRKNQNFSASNLGHKKPSIEEEGQFAADFQQQHHHQRWGKDGINGIAPQRYPQRSTRRFDKRIPNRRQGNMFGQKSGGIYQSPLLKTFSTTSRDSFYDYEDPLPYDDIDVDDYMAEDKNMNKISVQDVINNKASHGHQNYDYYGDYGMQTSGATDITFADRIIDGTIDAFFSIPVLTLFSLLALPIILAASYWLFVVNGPTPVVKARIDDLLGIISGNDENVSEDSLGMNNFVSGDDVTYTQVTPLWDSIGKPIWNTLLSILQKFGSVSPDPTSSNTGGFVNKEPLFSGLFGDNFFG